jgi:hypothetical protein
VTPHETVPGSGAVRRVAERTRASGAISAGGVGGGRR